MNQENHFTNQTVRVNCNIRGSAAEALLELKRRGIIQNNREAVVQAILALQEKTTKSDIERNKLRNLVEQRVYLHPWEEIVGTLNGLETTETCTIAFLTCTIEKHIAIAIDKDFAETHQLKRLLGKKIALLKTDNPQKPFAIKTIHQKNNKPQNKTYSETTVTRYMHIPNPPFRDRFCGVD